MSVSNAVSLPGLSRYFPGVQAVVGAEHDVRVAFEAVRCESPLHASDRVLWEGRIVEAKPSDDMLNSDNPFIRQFLSGESEGPLTMD
jgi:ABC-type transporter Mla maintaining outer membrane lipid asymmetry ATPase subunit MlaF